MSRSHTSLDRSTRPSDRLLGALGLLILLSGPALAAESGTGQLPVWLTTTPTGTALPVLLSGDQPPGPAGSASSFARTEYQVFGDGASLRWRQVQVGGGSIGGNQLDQKGGGGGVGPKLKSGFLSLLLPGAGQFLNGDRKKAYIFAGAEVAIWASYFTFNVQGNNRQDTYEEYAEIYAGVNGSHSDTYWQAVGRYMDSDAYNEARRREARALGEEPSGLVGPEDAWQWRNERHLESYQVLRADANRAFDRRNFVTLFAIVNRAVSVYDAVRNAVDDKLSTEVLGFQVDFDVDPSLDNLRTGCVVTRKF